MGARDISRWLFTWTISFFLIYILNWLSFSTIGVMNILLQSITLFFALYYCTSKIKKKRLDISCFFLIIFFSHPLTMELSYNFWNPSFSVPFHLLSFFCVYQVTYSSYKTDIIEIALLLLVVYLGSQCHLSTVVWIPLFMVALLSKKDWRGFCVLLTMLVLSLISLNILYGGKFIENFALAEKNILNSEKHQGYLGTIGGNEFLIKLKRFFWIIYNFIGGRFPMTTFGIRKDRMRWIDSRSISAWWEWTLVLIPSILSLSLFVRGFLKESRLRVVLVAAALISIVIVYQDSVDGSEFAQYRRHLFLLPLFSYFICSGLRTIKYRDLTVLITSFFWLVYFFYFNYNTEPSQRVSALRQTMKTIMSESSMSEEEVLFFSSSIQERTWSDLSQVLVPKFSYKTMGISLVQKNMTRLSFPLGK